MRCALANHVQHLLHVQTGFHAKGHSFAQTLQQSGDANLVDHFGELACATLTHQGDRLGEGHGHGLHALKRCRLTTAHHRQHAIDGTRFATRHGGIDKMHTQRLGRCKQFTRHLGRGGGVVHQHGTSFHASQGAIDAQHDSAQIVIVADAAKHHVGALSGLTWGGRTGLVGKLRAPVGGFGGVAVVHRDMVSCQCQVTGHRVTHDAQADEGNFGGRGGFVGFGVGACHELLSNGEATHLNGPTSWCGCLCGVVQGFCGCDAALRHQASQRLRQSLHAKLRARLQHIGQL